MMFEAALTLLATFITGTVLSRGLWDGTIAPLTGYLNIYVIGFAAFFCLIFLQRSRLARQDLAVFLVVLAAFGSILMIEAGRQAQVRRQLPLPQNANDGIVQSVEAAKFLLHGQNPYTADFSLTPFGVFNAAIGDSPVDRVKPRNLAADHYVYLPMIFLVQTPLVIFSNLARLTIDYQSLSLVFFLATVALLLWISPTWSQRTISLLLTIGNPFLWVYALGGYSDFILIFPLALSFVAIDRHRPVLGSAAFGLALAAKQTAWLLLPLWAYWAWKQNGGNTKATWRQIGISMGFAGAVLLPFFLWNPSAMYDDTIRYLSGTIPWSYPISNATLAQYLVQFGIVRNSWTPVSLWPLQLFALGLTGWWMYSWLTKTVTASKVLAVSAVLTLVATITNRVGADNYFMTPIMLSLFAYALATRDRDAEAVKNRP